MDRAEKFVESLSFNRKIDDVWSFLVDRFSRFKYTDITDNAIHLVGPSGDSVATIIRSDGKIVVHDYTPMLSTDENRVNHSFYVRVKNVLRTAEARFDFRFKVLKMYPGWRGIVETNIEELFY